MRTQRIQKLVRNKMWKYIAVPLLAFVALSSWGLSSPVGSSPDDNFHLASIWCGQGERQGLCEDIPGTTEAKLLPMQLAISTCYAYKPEVSGSCQTDMYGEETTLVKFGPGNFEGLYPPFFYWVMSFFAGSNVALSVVMMRLFNSFLFVGLVSVTYFLVPQRIKRPVLWGGIVSSVPLALFIIPSTNPSSWAVASAATLWALLIGFLKSDLIKSRIIFASLALLSTIIGAGSRADSAIFSIIAVVVAIIIAVENYKKLNFFSIAVILAIVSVSVYFYLNAGQSQAVASGLAPNLEASGIQQKIHLFVANILQVPTIWAGILGSWGLGWLDTTLPFIVQIFSFTIFAGLAFWGLGLIQRTKLDKVRKLLAVSLLFFALYLYPTVVLVQTGAIAGGYFQPRYILPLGIIFLSLLLLGSTDQNQKQRINRPQSLAIVIALSVANVFALHTNMRRYLSGTDHVSWNLNSMVEWWWEIPIQPMTIWIIGSLSFSLLLFAAFPIWRYSGNTKKLVLLS